MSEIRLITKDQVAQRLCMSERTLEKLVKSCQFPPPLRLGKHVQWVESVVNNWLELKAAKQLTWVEPKRRRAA